MIWLLLNIVYTASIPSLFSCSYPSVNRLGVYLPPAETTDPGWPKGYPIPYDIMLNNKMGGSFSKVAVAQGLAGHLSVGGGCFCITFFSSLYCLNVNPRVCSRIPFFSLPSWWGGGSKGVEGSYLLSGLYPLHFLNCTVTSEEPLWLICVMCSQRNTQSIFSYTSVRCHW